MKYKLLPKKPTKEMLEAVKFPHDTPIDEAYSQMWQAATHVICKNKKPITEEKFLEILGRHITYISEINANPWLIFAIVRDVEKEHGIEESSQ